MKCLPGRVPQKDKGVLCILDRTIYVEAPRRECVLLELLLAGAKLSLDMLLDFGNLVLAALSNDCLQGIRCLIIRCRQIGSTVGETAARMSA